MTTRRPSAKCLQNRGTCGSPRSWCHAAQVRLSHGHEPAVRRYLRPGCGWYAAARRYEDFLRRHRGRRLLFLELGVGGNTPGIIKYPFWKMTLENRSAAYACINQKESYIPPEIRGRSVCIPADIGHILKRLTLLEH